MQSADISTDLKIDSSTVVRIEENHERGTAILGFSVGEQRVQVRSKVKAIRVWLEGDAAEWTPVGVICARINVVWLHSSVAVAKLSVHQLGLLASKML